MLRSDMKIARYMLIGASVCMVLINLGCVSAQTNTPSYTVREVALDTFISMLMIVALGGFMLLEDKLPYINKRTFVWNVFLTQTVISILFCFFAEESPMPIFALGEMNTVWHVSKIVFVVRGMLLLWIPLVNKWFVKVYCLAMMACQGVAFLAVMFDMGLVEDNTLGSVALILADVCFYVALYSFADVMTDDNKWKIHLPFLDKFLNDEDEDDPTLKSTLGVDYWLVRSYALNEKKDDFAKTDIFFERLSKGILWDEQHRYYSTEEYAMHLSVLKDLVGEILERWDGYLSPQFAFVIDLLLDKTHTYMFQADVVMAAGLFLGDDMDELNWMYITDRHNMYMEAVKKGSQENAEGDEV